MLPILAGAKRVAKETSTRFVSSFSAWKASVSTSEVCPDLPTNEVTLKLFGEGIREAELTGQPVIVKATTGTSAHHYFYMEKVADLKELPPDWLRNVGLKDSPLTFPITWLTSLGSGNSRLEGGKLEAAALESGAPQNVSIFGAGRWPFADVISLSPDPIHGDPSTVANPIRVHSFQAKTRAGHALTGTVKHSLIFTATAVYFCALGASMQGPIIVGGGINNSVACSLLWGSWPTLAYNMRRNLLDPQFAGRVMGCIKEGEFDNAALERSQVALRTALPWSEWSRQKGTSGLVYTGAPMRILSWFYYGFWSYWSGKPLDRDKD